MNKPNRLALITAIATSQMHVSAVAARPEEIKEETSLVANPLDNDNNIEDEDTNHLASKELISRIDTVSDSREGADSLLFNEKEKRELGQKSFFKTKAAAKVEEEDYAITEEINYQELAAWADSFAAV